MGRFRKKPVVIDAIRFTGDNKTEVVDFIRGSYPWIALDAEGYTIDILTLEGTMRASRGDWIVRGVNGEYYPCKPDIFEKTYEAAPDDI